MGTVIYWLSVNPRFLPISICLLHKLQGLVESTEQERSARAGDKRKAGEGDDGNERTGRAGSGSFRPRFL